ncbi:DUF2946 domain-containing protein [Pseudomonas lini]|uniref:DUF2946 domain-containing protein n=1 Tax=Pseudomonas lini TaxID=163011 RepID=A0A0J6K798_9PSED|nr:DUF2946 domain-containing protein [Pseudomonas lini]KAB0504996.1 DUF2946 domain-containing protein [Pseudomonas lini]KMM91777.1 hypothetical protein TU81_17745 [Pseudomonas lini]KNH46174.1 hypothetical protein ACS73_12245 [Pseudomonas lini]NSX11149.1 DUF2946 domain-containing protein [Pseudomonas lini]SDR97005.1 Protein of unknown function [Pseudomonas lini]
MSRQRLAFAWIACFAVLFNMLAMPMSGAMAQTAKSPAEQLLWGSFCSSNGTKLVAISLGDIEQKAPQSDDHSNMQHCWCCSGSAPLVALPGHAQQLYFARFEANRSLPPATLDTPTRQQWPSLNPRASPLV